MEISYEQFNRINRSKNECMFLLDIDIENNIENNKYININICGSSGYLYNIIINDIITCNCPDNNDNTIYCKHICYVLNIICNNVIEFIKNNSKINVNDINLENIKSYINKTSQLYKNYVKIKELHKNKNENKLLECVICYDMEYIDFLCDTCKKNVCKNCSIMWFKNNKTCPYCRCEIHYINNNCVTNNYINLFS